MAESDISLVRKLQDGINDLDSTPVTIHDEASRLQALSLAQTLCHRLETPWEKIVRLYWAEVFDAPVFQKSMNLSLSLTRGADCVYDN